MTCAVCALVGVAPAREVGDRGPAERARIVRPVVGVVRAHRVEHDPFAQRPVADGQGLDVEQVERGDEQHRAGRQELGPLLLEAGQAAAVGDLGPHDAFVQRSQVLTRDAQAVRDRGHVARRLRDGHAREVVDRAARADAHAAATG